MRVLEVGFDPAAEGALRAALEAVAGQSVELLRADDLGQAWSLLSSGVDVVLLSLELAFASAGPREPLAGALFCWYLGRAFPDMTIWVFAGSAGPDPLALPWIGQPNVRLEQADPGAGDWAERFRRHHQLAYQASALPLAWWESRQWLASSAEGESVACHGIEDPELMGDLLAFLQLKATQLAHCWEDKPWQGLELSSATTRVEITSAASQTIIMAIEDLDHPSQQPLPAQTLQQLQERGLVQPCP